MDKLKNLLDKNEVKEVKILLEKLVKLYKTNSKIVDHIYTESELNKKYEISPTVHRDKHNVVKLIK